mmetsp:Transcript_35198/g.93270  ORF Transcript_35198/g.93270 Transcript_35198/m.93270 type:complete len:214 (-) Transcript_35198:690-1331(-)
MAAQPNQSGRVPRVGWLIHRVPHRLPRPPRPPGLAARRLPHRGRARGESERQELHAGGERECRRLAGRRSALREDAAERGAQPRPRGPHGEPRRRRPVRGEEDAHGVGHQKPGGVRGRPRRADRAALVRHRHREVPAVEELRLRLPTPRHVPRRPEHLRRVGAGLGGRRLLVVHQRALPLPGAGGRHQAGDQADDVGGLLAPRPGHRAQGHLP